MYLVVQPTGTRSWFQRLVIRSRKRELGLGSTALVSLAEARDRALSNRKFAREGGDPLAEKRRADAMPTFADAAARIVEQKRAGWRSPPIHARTWLNSLERHAFPRIGGWSVSEVTSADVLEVLTPIWHVKLQTARCVRQRISAVMEWASAMNLRTDNPCDRGRAGARQAARGRAAHAGAAALGRGGGDLDGSGVGGGRGLGPLGVALREIVGYT